MTAEIVAYFFLFIAVSANLYSNWNLWRNLLEYKAMGDHVKRITELEIELEAMNRATHTIQWMDPDEVRRQKEENFAKAPTQEEIEAGDDEFNNIQ